MADLKDKPGRHSSGRSGAKHDRSPVKGLAPSVDASAQRTASSPVRDEASRPDSDALSPHYNELMRLAARADQGATVSASDMSDEEFLKAFLGS